MNSLLYFDYYFKKKVHKELVNKMISFTDFDDTDTAFCLYKLLPYRRH